jgi:transposase-like protein
MVRHRSFNSEFKQQLSRDFLEGRAGMHELARLYSISRILIRLWIRKYEAGEFNDELAEARADRRVRAQNRRLGPESRTANDGSRPAQKGGAGRVRERRELLYRERPQALTIAQGCRLMKLARSTYL